MKLIKRVMYLNQLINRKENGLIKIIPGIRRQEKAIFFLKIFHNHLLECGVKEEKVTIAITFNLHFQFLMKPKWLKKLLH